MGTRRRDGCEQLQGQTSQTNNNQSRFYSIWLVLVVWYNMCPHVLLHVSLYCWHVSLCLISCVLMLDCMCPYTVPMMEYDSETEEWVEVSGASCVSDVPKVCDCLKVPLYILMDTTPNDRIPKKRPGCLVLRVCLMFPRYVTVLKFPCIYTNGHHPKL